MIRVLLLLRKKPGMSREDFIEYYEKHHAPLSVKLIPGLLEYRRSYIEPGPAPFGHPASAPDFDVVTELVFATRQDYERALNAFTDPALQETFMNDEAQLFDRSKPHRAFYVTEFQSALPSQV